MDCVDHVGMSSDLSTYSCDFTDAFCQDSQVERLLLAFPGQVPQKEGGQDRLYVEFLLIPDALLIISRLCPQEAGNPG